MLDNDGYKAIPLHLPEQEIFRPYPAKVGNVRIFSSTVVLRDFLFPARNHLICHIARDNSVVRKLEVRDRTAFRKLITILFTENLYIFSKREQTIPFIPRGFLENAQFFKLRDE